ncbi:MAG: hypothetical protein R3D71_03605 [Rickettsiales bacterium]
MGFSLKGKFRGTNSRPSSSVSHTYSKVKSDADNKVGVISPFKSTTGNKYGIIIGDEGAVLIYVVGKDVKSRNFIAQASHDNLKEFHNILAKDKEAPIYLIIDSMDQNFSQQSLPPISALGVRKLIKRRMERELAADVVKGYILLDRDKAGRRDWNFLMVSLENSPQLNVWFEFTESLDNRVNGVYLLSIESENIITTIDKALGINQKKKNSVKNSASRWKFFVTHNKVGGVRQVIIKDGNVVFTRLTQPVGEETAEVVVGNIEQEMLSTIEYIRRLSFDYKQGIDIYLLASDEIGELIDTSNMQPNNVHKFTPYELSQLFSIGGAAQQMDRFGDVILTAFITSSSSHRLTLFLPKMEKVNKIYNIIRYQWVASIILAISMISYVGFICFSIYSKIVDIDDLDKQKTLRKSEFDNVNKKIKESGIEVKRISDTVFLYDKIVEENTSPIALLSKARSAIIKAVSIREVYWGEEQTGKSLGNPSADNSNAKLSIVLRFPEISNTEEAFRAVARKVLLDLRKELPEYDIYYTKLPDAISKKTESEEIVFNDNKDVMIIDKSSLEATLSFVKKGSGTVSDISTGQDGSSTDKLIGLGR